MRKLNSVMGIVIAGQISCGGILSEKLKHLEYATAQSEQITAIRQLSSECQFGAIPSLTKLLQNTKDPQIKNEVLFALGQMRAYEALPVIRDIADKKDEYFKPSLVAMAQIGTDSSVDYVLYQLSYNDAETRILVLSALKYAPNYPIISKLSDALMSVDLDVGVHQAADNLSYRFNPPRCKARLAQEKMTFPAAMQFLRTLLAQEIDALIKKIIDVSLPGAESAKAIKDLEEVPYHQKNPRFSEVLLTALLDSREEVRIAALSLERVARDRDALLIVHSLLEDPSLKVRTEAFSVAAAIGNNTTLDRFYEIANNPKNKSKLMAIKYIGLYSRHNHSKYGLGMLERLSTSSDGPTTYLAKEELRSVQEEFARPQIDFK